MSVWGVAVEEETSTPTDPETPAPTVMLEPTQTFSKDFPAPEIPVIGSLKEAETAYIEFLKGLEQSLGDEDKFEDDKYTKAYIQEFESGILKQIPADEKTKLADFFDRERYAARARMEVVDNTTVRVLARDLPQAGLNFLRIPHAFYTPGYYLAHMFVSPGSFSPVENTFRSVKMTDDERNLISALQLGAEFLNSAPYYDVHFTDLWEGTKGNELNSYDASLVLLLDEYRETMAAATANQLLEDQLFESGHKMDDSLFVATVGIHGLTALRNSIDFMRERPRSILSASTCEGNTENGFDYGKPDSQPIDCGATENFASVGDKYVPGAIGTMFGNSIHLLTTNLIGQYADPIAGLPAVGAAFVFPLVGSAITAANPDFTYNLNDRSGNTGQYPMHLSPEQKDDARTRSLVELFGHGLDGAGAAIFRSTGTKKARLMIRMCRSR
jgi:hypothetical protein